MRGRSLTPTGLAQERALLGKGPAGHAPSIWGGRGTWVPHGVSTTALTDHVNSV